MDLDSMPLSEKYEATSPPPTAPAIADPLGRDGVILLADDDPLWDVLDVHPDFPLYRKRAWKEVVGRTYGHEGYYLAAFRQGVLADLLPFFLVQDPLRRRKLISTPYQGSNGGFLTTDAALRRAMSERIKEMAHLLKVQYVEIRSATPLPELLNAGFVARETLLISIAPLSTPEENWERLSPKHRRNVRTAEKNGIVVEESRRWEDMRIFYGMLTDHYKRLGTPFPGPSFFRQMWERLVLRGKARLLIARHGQEVIGGQLLLFNGKTLVSKYGVTLHHERYAKLYAAYLLFWEAIRQGAEMGFTAFDLGITGQGNEGLRCFKTRLGAVEHPLHFYYYRLSGEIPDYDRYYGSYKLARALWRLAPRAVTTLAGAYINAWIC